MARALDVVFYRGLNLGHAGAPTRAELEEALVGAGALRVKSFQTNGTVLVEAEDTGAVVRAAAEAVREQSGYADAALIRPFALLVDTLSADPFAGHSDPRTYRHALTFFDGGRELRLATPWTNERDDVDIVEVRDGMALSAIRKPRNTAGSPTAEIERLTGGVATTRTLGTVERLVAAGLGW